MIRVNYDKTFSPDAFLNRFNRQIKIPKWGDEEQKKIFDKKILILSNGNLGEIVLAGLASFGARNIFYQDYKDISSEKSYFSNVQKSGTRLEKIVKTVARINPFARIYGYSAPFTKFYMNLEGFIPEIIIDATNDRESKERVLNYLEKNKSIKLISGVSNENSCAVSVYEQQRRNYDDILKQKIKTESEVQGGFTSTIAAGLIIEEFRKSIFQLNEDDHNAEETIYYNRNSSTRNSPISDISNGKISRDQRILIAGCGGIGTYVGLGLAQEEFSNISFLDMDIVEDTNLNRQMLFYDDVGKKKSLSLSEKLMRVYKINPRVFSGELNFSSGEKLFEDLRPDLVLGCFDNINARISLNDLAVEYHVPYIDGATTYNTGQITSYIPNKTECVKCKRGFIPQEIEKGNSCDNSLPSVISPNMIIGSMMVGESMSYFSGLYEDLSLTYNTEGSDKIRTHPETIKSCNEGTLEKSS